MMENAYTVVAIFEAKTGKEESLKQALLSIVKPSRAETACLEYRLHQDTGYPGKFIFYENWQSKAAHEHHLQTPHFKAILEKLDSLLEKSPTVIFAKEL